MPGITPSQATTLIEGLKSTGGDDTHAAYAKDLHDFVGFLDVKDEKAALCRLLSGTFDAADGIVRRYRDSMSSSQGRGLASSTVNRRLTVLRRIAKAAHRRGWITWLIDVPSMKSELVKNPDGPTLEKATEMLAMAAKQKGQAGRRTYAILRLALDLGLRRGAIVGLDAGDVDLVNRTVWVVLKGHDKKKQKDLAETTCVALQRWLDVHPTKSMTPATPVFVNLIPGRHTRLNGSTIYDIVRDISVAVGSRTRPHGLRHTAITEAVLRATAIGETLDQVRAFSDHTDFKMVLRYRNTSARVQKKFTESNAKAFGDPLRVRSHRSQAA
jgi:integrase/recombinase XerC